MFRWLPFVSASLAFRFPEHRSSCRLRLRTASLLACAWEERSVSAAFLRTSVGCRGHDCSAEAILNLGFSHLHQFRRLRKKAESSKSLAKPTLKAVGGCLLDWNACLFLRDKRP